MFEKEKDMSRAVRRRVVITAALFWTGIIVLSACWNWVQVGGSMTTLAVNEARSTFNKDVIYRRWVAQQGGVYVPPSDKTPPNPHLAHLPNRDVTTISGQRLTLVNPAYMTRQIHEMGKARYGLQGHITSLRPLRPENAPDAWETAALKAFENGTSEVMTHAPIDGKPFVRLMWPFRTEEGCLKCHARQGYAVGDIRGGISVSVPLGPHLAEARRQRTILVFAHIFIGLLGLGGLWAASGLLSRADKRMLKARNFLNTLVETLPIPVFYKDRQGMYAGCNRSFESFLGKSRDDIIGKGVFDLAPFDLAETYQDRDKALYEKAGTQVYEARVKDARGELRHVIFHKAALVDETEKVMGIIGAVLDMTDYRRAEEALRASHHQFRQIIEFLPDATFVIDREGRLLAWNRAVEDLTGFKAEDMIGKGDHEYAVPFYHERRPVMIDLVISNDHSLDAMYAYVKRNRERFESESFIPHLRPGGAYLYNTASALYDAEGHLMGAIESIRDITEQKQAQAALEESRRQLSEILDFFPDPLFVIDAESRVVAWNRAMEELTGFKAEDMIGKGDHEYALPFYGERRPILIDLALSWDESYREKYLSVIRRDDGVLTSESYHPRLKGGIYLAGTACVLPDEAGMPRWAIESLRDITAVKEAEKALRAARETAEQASLAKSEFLANMSHEIRTPLNGVIGMTGLLLDTSLGEEQRRYAEIVRSSGAVLLSIINDVLDLSKIEAGKLDLETIDFDLYSLLDDFVAGQAIRAHEKGLELVFGIDPSVPALLRGDPGRLRQVLNNLVGNAVKFTLKGDVTLRVSLETESPEAVILRFDVHDTGIGIPQDRMGMIFEKFTQADASTTRRFGGTGLGLAISRRLAERMDGVIHAESREGEGSRFRFTVPFLKQAGASPPPPPADLRGVRVLVVDDNATNREILSLRLKTWGMRPKDASGGQEGLDLLRGAADDGDPFRIVLTDMQMPHMDGETFCRAVRADRRLARIPLVLLTSLGIRGEARRFKEMGFSGYLTKPISHSDLLEMVQQVLADPRAVSGTLVTRHWVREQKRLTDLAGKRVLLVEDNLTNRQVALGILEKLGIHADVAENGLEAIAALKTTPCHLILMDVQMPVMDGLEATRRIRALKDGGQRTDDGPQPSALRHPTSDVPIVAMTAHALQGDREKCLAAGMNDYIPKPIDPQVLAAVLRKWLAPEGEGRRVKDGGRRSEDPAEGEGVSDEIRDLSVFDRESLVGRLMGDGDMAGRVMEGFLLDIPRQIQALKDFIASGKAADAERQAHTIKGAAANVGGERMRQAAFCVENAARSGDPAAAASLVETLETEFNRLKSAMKREG